MKPALNISSTFRDPRFVTYGLIGTGYLLILVFLLRDYFELNLVLFAGLAFSPYLFIVRDKNSMTNRYFLVALLIIGVSFFIKIKTVYFISLVFAILFLFESIAGKLNYLPVVVLILLCPIFTYISSFIGIPARLTLTELAGKILNAAHFDALVMGNIIQIKGEEFSVDPACMGLNMMSISFLLGMFIIAFYERKTGKKLTVFSTSLCLLLIFVLNVLSNLLRIIVLVIFKIAPDNFLHDITGIVCLLVYVVIPFIILTKLIYNSRPEEKEDQTTVLRKTKYRTIKNIALLSLIAFKSLQLKQDAEKANLLPAVCHIDHYNKKIVNKHVLKFEKENFLVYVKPVNSFYGAEHTPMICWTGSGYEFKNIHKKIVNEKEIYIGILQKGKDILYTAWWFDNGTYKTIDQFDWRWRVMKGENEFSLINVNSSNEKDLLSELNNLLNKNIFI
jgi:exosortase N